MFDPTVRKITPLPTPTPPVQYIVTIDQETAEVIVALAWRCAGHPDGPRGRLQKFSQALREVGVKLPAWDNLMSFYGAAMHCRGGIQMPNDFGPTPYGP